MIELEAIGEVEKRYELPRGEPSLGEAYALLSRRWQDGARDVDTALRLMFLAWYTNCEPVYLTGLPSHEPTCDMFDEVFQAMGGVDNVDPLFHFAVGYMADAFPWACGAEEVWAKRAQECQARYESLGAPRFTPEDFAGRGAFGRYFAHVVRGRKRDG